MTEGPSPYPRPCGVLAFVLTGGGNCTATPLFKQSDLEKKRESPELTPPLIPS